jgi:hypothetical protein
MAKPTTFEPWWVVTDRRGCAPPSSLAVNFTRWRLSMMYSSGVVGSPFSWSIGAGPSRSWSPTAGVTLRAGLPEVITLILQARRE